MKIKKVSIRLGLALLIVILLIGFMQIPSLRSENLKALLPADTFDNVIWGQAYSPNAGWINFYCDGEGHTQPPVIRADFPNKGAATMGDSCESIAYSASYNSSTETFSGVAYSTNYGWLDMEGLTMTAPIFTQTTPSEVIGSTTGSTLGADYNFGQTYFEKSQPNPFNSGVRYYNTEGYFCGFAYSDEAGYISFCDPQTKEQPPKNVSVLGYDWDTYAVYSGFAEGDDSVPPVIIIPDPDAPDNPESPGTPVGKILGADDAYSYTIDFVDGGEEGDPKTGIASIEIKVMDSNGVEKTYSSSDSESVLISNHDFNTAGYYQLTAHSCDYASNCSNYASSNFFHVVANVPDWSQSYFAFTNGTKISDSVSGHTVEVVLIDKYGNPVIPVDGIKTVAVNFIFENTTRRDQLGGLGILGDAAIFTSTALGLDQTGGTETGFLSGALNSYQIDVASFTPTSNGYSPIADDGFDLNFDEIEYDIATLDGYSNVGETATIQAQSTLDGNKEFKFSPTLTSTPINNGDTITNMTTYFDIGFENFSSSESTSNPEIGLLLEADEPEIVWQDAKTEDLIETNINLDISTISPFDPTLLNDISAFIGGITPGTTDNLNISALPKLDVGVTFNEFETLVGTYLGYTLNGEYVSHKSNFDSDGGATYRPYIDIIGLARSEGGIDSKKDNTDLNQSLGDFARAEFKSSVNRSTASIRNEDGCSGDFTINDLDTFIVNNPNCVYNDNGVIYFESALGSDITLDLSGDLPDQALTLIIEGGDLFIKSDLNYPASSTLASFGIIALKDSTSNAGGNVFVYPNVKNISTVLYAEGSLISVSATGGYEESDFAPNRYDELRNQLYWQGIIVTLNTIGGSDQSPLNCPDDISCGSRGEARIYDFNYFRTFYPELISADSYRAVITPSNDATLIVKYDARIQNNPPLLFEFATDSSNGEIGY